MKKHFYFFIAFFVCANSVFAQQKKHDELRNKLSAIVSKHKALVGLSVIELETKDSLTLNNQIQYTTQSVFKFPLALTVMHLAEKRKINLGEKVLIKPNMWKQFGWSPLKTRYSGDSLYISIDSLIMYSISYSDNLSTDKLFEIIGGPKVANDYIRKLGIKNINIKLTELEMSKTRETMHENNSSPYDMSFLLIKFYEGKVLNKFYREKLLHYMVVNFSSDARLKGALPKETMVAHKTGTGSFDTTLIDACNDVGIIYLPNGKHLAVSVFIMNSYETYSTTENIIAQIGSQIFSEFHKNQSTISNAKNEIGNNPSAGKYITLNGAKHYYEVYGEGKPLLLIHGNSTPTRGWASQIEFFKKKYKVYSIDCRGRGKSELGGDSLTYMQQAKDIAEFIEKLELDSVNIVGKSDGGIIGILLGIYFPEHIKKIIAFGANMQPDTTALYAESVKEIHDERIKADKMLAENNNSKNWLIEQQRYRMMEYQPHITADDLHKIKLPVLVMSTDRDLIKEEHTLFIYKNIPRANLCILPNEKHGIAKLNPDLFNDMVDKYLSEPFHGVEFRFEK